MTPQLGNPDTEVDRRVHSAKQFDGGPRTTRCIAAADVALLGITVYCGGSMNGSLDPQKMNQFELLTVEESFMIDQLGLVVEPDFAVPNNDWRPSEEDVTIRRPDGSRFEAVAKFNHSHLNISDPTVPIDRRWRVTICILNVAKEDVPIGSRLLVRKELANRLLESRV